MFTKNAYKCLGVVARLAQKASVIGEDGNWYTTYVPNSSYEAGWRYGGSTSGSSLLNLPRDSAMYGVRFGTGNTPPTEDDYKLSGNIVTNLSFITKITLVNDDNGGGTTATYTITNNGSEAVTIAEVAIMARILTDASGSNAAVTLQLWERTVLDYPVTIPAGGVGQVTYTVRMDWPT